MREGENEGEGEGLIRVHAADYARVNDYGSYDIVVWDVAKRDVVSIQVSTDGPEEQEQAFGVYIGGARVYQAAVKDHEPVEMFPTKNVPLSRIYGQRVLFVMHDVHDLVFNIIFHISYGQTVARGDSMTWPWPTNNNNMRFAQGLAGLCLLPFEEARCEEVYPECPMRPGRYIRLLDDIDDYDCTWPVMSLCARPDCKGVLARFEFPAGKHIVQANMDALQLLSESCRVSGLDSQDDLLRQGQYVHWLNSRAFGEGHTEFVIESETPIIYDKIYLQNDARAKLLDGDKEYIRDHLIV